MSIPQMLASALVLSLCATPRALHAAAAPPAGGEAIGLYPIVLPEGQEALQARLAAQLHDGAATLPGVRAFDLIAKGACLPDEGPCLAEAARHADLTQIVSAQVSPLPSGYRFHVRAFAAGDGALRGEEQGEVAGGPLDLAGALERGVCVALGAGTCNGTLRVGLMPGDGVQASLVVDGKDLGPLPLAQPVSLPVGRHLVQAGGAERRVRISYGREARLVCASRAGAPALLDEAEALAEAAPASALTQSVGPRVAGSGRALVARVLLASGAALLATSAGLELYSRTAASQGGTQARAGAVAGADTTSSSARAAGTIALMLGATGLGALGAGGILVAVTPGGLAAVGHF